VQDFRNLKVWQKAYALTIDVYRVTRAFPKEELYGITSQARRAAVSIGANLAEGCGRNGDAEFAQFSNIAMGSACELEHLLILSQDLGFVSPPTCARLTHDPVEIKRMLASLIYALHSTS
jgi:four helix bundle protein